MKVFILIERDYDNSIIMGVYSSMKVASEKQRDLILNQSKSKAKLNPIILEIEEHILHE